jgi:ATP-binding cassette subfamily F protein 3
MPARYDVSFSARSRFSLRVQSGRWVPRVSSIVLIVDSITKHYGPDPVLDGVSFELRAKQRVGLVGPNGTGKTTLLNIVSGQVEADHGLVHWAPQAQVGYVRQQSEFTAGRTVWDEAEHALGDQLAMSKEAIRLAEMIALTVDAMERHDLEARYDTLQEELTRRDAYHLDHKIERVLQGLGFTADGYRQPVEQLSGGQQNRLMLAKLLLSAPDVLLLDEPSNHLDIDGTTWLEEFLINSPQAVLVVSHDRYFLDRVTDHTLELFHGTVDTYRGNYSAYCRQKAERLEVQRRTYENQQAEIAKLEDFVRRHHYGQKHAQAEDRRKKLERIERVPPPRAIDAPPMGFPEAPRSGDIVLRIERLSKAYDRPLFEQLSFDVLRGQRWGIMGSNGTGKTTLLRCILGLEDADAGSAVLGTGVVAGYFDQMLSLLDHNMPALEAVRPPGKEFNEQQRRDMLARFGIRGDMVFQRIHQLSGGERNRVALARLAASDVNFLVLDEPTNHLDLWAREALERALRQFNGTIFCVSHDRYFLNQVVDHLLVLRPGHHQLVLGNFDDYQRARSPATSRSAVVNRSGSGSDILTAVKADKRQEKPGGKPRRKRRFPYRRVEDIEADIFRKEAEVESLHDRLQCPDVLREGSQVRAIQQQIDAAQAELQSLYEHWEEATELN